MPELIYINGDITNPIEDKCVIAHVVNDIGVMGSGVAKALYTKWLDVKEYYLYWSAFENYKNYIDEKEIKVPFELGQIQSILVESLFRSDRASNRTIVVVNMVAQHSTIAYGEKIPIRYDALEECLKKTYEVCLDWNFNLHIPKIGSGLARGDWNIIEGIIKETMKVNTYVYEFQN